MMEISKLGYLGYLGFLGLLGLRNRKLYALYSLYALFPFLSLMLKTYRPSLSIKQKGVLLNRGLKQAVI